ncbi:OmpG porin family protein [Vibrio renipiscarius]|uniref:Porin n=1 Tax=Vibrio renipiscarius TaxID=1461322 RepID=A0A0C2K9S8_9VIBR|nr:OmpG porin family protein [Vibrio renipiscarius]KII75321.1 hypothetical protein OJ16_18705 [Vibrio renipiscarius]KII78773.1 hypothetical protein PL18_10815 [Vibrio renipiscarius]
MKKQLIIPSLLALCVSQAAWSSNHTSPNGGGKTGIQPHHLSILENATLLEENQEYDDLEVEVTYHQPARSTIHGNYATKIETEIEYNDEGDATWSKVKYVLGEGTVRPESWGNWFMFYHVAREDFYQGKPYSEQFENGEIGNSIMELQPHYVEGTEWGHWGINVGITHESLSGGLFKPRVRPFGSYRITDNVEVFTSWMFFKEMFYKEGNTDKNILETDSALIYHFDGGNVALGYFAKFGQNIDDDHSRIYDDGSKHEQFGKFSELIWKPRVHYRFDNGLGVTLYGEIGKYEDKTTELASGQTYDLYEEWFRKYGVFMDYPINDNIILFGEANYREGRVKETYANTNFYETRDRTHNFAMIGVNFLF